MPGVKDLRLLPKAHLHTHLESAIRPATLRALGGDPIARDRPLAGFREFADQRAATRALLREPRDFRRIAEEFCQDEAAQGVHYAEVTFTAAAHGERVGDPRMPLEAVIEGLALGQERYGIRTRIVLDHSRRRPPARLRATLALASRYPQVAAVGLAGEEAYPAQPFAREFRAAREAGIHLVHHAGESAGPASVREALAVGHAERLGHGIRVLDDPVLVAELRDRRLPLEVCPSSNVLLGLVPSLAEHPLPRLIDAGLTVTLNTDGEAALTGEYERARQHFGYSDGELADLARASVRASFAPPAVKEQILAGIDQWLHPAPARPLPRRPDGG